MNINIKHIDVVVIKPSGRINVYRGNMFYHSMQDTVMIDCSIDVDDCKVRIDGKEVEYDDGVWVDLEGKSWKELNEKYYNSGQFKPHPRVSYVNPFRPKIVRDWKFSDSKLRLRKNRRVVRVLSLNNYQLRIHRDELDNR